MTTAEYDALVDRERALWLELLAMERAVKAKDAEWEAAAEAIHTENKLRENTERSVSV